MWNKKGIRIWISVMVLVCIWGSAFFKVAASSIRDMTGTMQEKSYELLVCVPIDTMSLREKPGLGEDVLAELPAGTYVKWYGQSKIRQGQEFYKVTVMDTEKEGYVAAAYCIAVDFLPDEENLTIVETDTTLYTYHMMEDDIRTLCERYPDRLTYDSIGNSRDGRTIYRVILGNPKAKHKIMVQAAIHGREYMNSQVVMKMIEYYAFYYDIAAFQKVTYRDLFENTAICIVPMANPDGVTISQLGVESLRNERLRQRVYECYKRDKKNLAYSVDVNGDVNWVDHYRNRNFNRARLKNKTEITYEEYQRIWKANANGVDLNNNFDAGWKGIRLKSAPSYGSYKGSEALSEPESYALAKIALEQDYECFISYHSRGQIIYYDVAGNSRQNARASLNFANLMDSWIKYEPANTKNDSSVNLGGFGDWVQLKLNKPSVTIESGKHVCPLQIEEFPSLWYRHRESWAMLGIQYYD